MAHPNGRMVVMATDDAVVKVTPISDRRVRKLPAQSRSPERDDRDQELAMWVEETRRHYRATQHLAAHQASLSTQPAPLASLETLASETHLKCGRNSLLGCLPNSPGSVITSSVTTYNPDDENASAGVDHKAQGGTDPACETIQNQCYRDTDSPASTVDSQMIQNNETCDSNNLSLDSQAPSQGAQQSYDTNEISRKSLENTPESPRTTSSHSSHSHVTPRHAPPDPDLSHPDPESQSHSSQIPPPNDPELSAYGLHLYQGSRRPNSQTDPSPRGSPDPDTRIPRPRPTSLDLPSPPPPVRTPERTPPPPYSPLGQEDWRLIYFDFPPRCINGGGILTTPVFETFDVLVRRANEWLRRHPSAKLKSAETVEHKTSLASPDTMVNTEQATLSDSEAAGTLTIKSLRLWIEPKPLHARHLAVQQLGYINVVPACTDPGGVKHRPQFDSQTVTLNKFNTLMKHRPMPGTVLNVETVPMKFRQYSKWVTPDRCYYRQHNDISSSYITMFRIYYVVGEPSWEEIGYRDFKPVWHDPQTGCAVSESGFEDFPHVVSEANRWAQNLPPDVHILNMHTLNAKTKITRDHRVYVNTEQAVHTLYASSAILQCLRVWYLRPPASTVHPSQPDLVLTPGLTPGLLPGIGDDLVNSPLTAGLVAGVMSTAATTRSTQRDDMLPSSLINLTCKAFYPLRCGQGGIFEDIQIESMSETKIRMTQWLKAHSHLSVLAVETSKLKLEQSLSFEHQVNQTLFHNRCDGSHSWTYVLRVYFNGELGDSVLPDYEEQESDYQYKSSKTCVIL